jgi:ribosome-binding ATPase YchF (GTP1/OBG family)
MKTVDIAGFPFTTIKANKGVAYLRTPCVCKELGVKDDPVNSACVNGVRLVPVDLIDCPGLIRGAHQGKGLGNRFLDEVRRADALIVVCDAAGSTDENGQPVLPGDHDPIDDIKMFESEFDLWLKSLVLKDWQKITRTAQSAREEIGNLLENKLTGLGINRSHIATAATNAKIDPYRASFWSKEDISLFVTELRKSSKPLIVAANKADKEPAVKNIERIQQAGYSVIPTCAEAELALRRAAAAGLIHYTPGDSDFEETPGKVTDKQKKALNLIREAVFEKWKTTGVQEAINSAFFKLLYRIPVYPVEDVEKLSDHEGRVLPDCYLIPKGTTAKEFAGYIHTDLKESFIYAVDGRTRKRLGENYEIQNDDVIQIVAAKARR